MCSSIPWAYSIVCRRVTNYVFAFSYFLLLLFLIAWAITQAERFWYWWDSTSTNFAYVWKQNELSICFFWWLIVVHCFKLVLWFLSIYSSIRFLHTKLLILDWNFELVTQNCCKQFARMKNQGFLSFDFVWENTVRVIVVAGVPHSYLHIKINLFYPTNLFSEWSLT